jgi:uncharacterized protein
MVLSCCRRIERMCGGFVLSLGRPVYDTSEVIRLGEGSDMGPVLTPVSVSLPQAIDRLVREFDPLRIVLFGSHARGTASADSDIDLLVVVPAMGDKRELGVAMLRSLRGVRHPIDVIPTDPQEIARRGSMPGDVLRSALLEGKVVYERGR